MKAHYLISRCQTSPKRIPVHPCRRSVIEVYRRDVDFTLIREQRRRTVDEGVARMIAALRLAEALGAARRREHS